MGVRFIDGMKTGGAVLIQQTVFCCLSIGMGFHCPFSKGAFYPADLQVIEKLARNGEIGAKENLTGPKEFFPGVVEVRLHCPDIT